jgi:2-octaprenyl-6-methoxyphenol hydroxylase
MKSFDILIVGGGLVGNSLACALAQQGLQIGIIETHAPSVSTDPRSIVLSYSSHIILQTLGLWSALESHAFPIAKVHVSQRGHFGAARFSAKEVGAAALGYVMPAAVLTNTLQQAALQQSGISLIAPAEVKQCKTSAENSEIIAQTPEGEETFTARLLIAADGSHSKLRAMQHIASTPYDYAQTAIIAIVEIALDYQHRFTAFECLTPTGPLALLPRDKNHCGVVWSVAKDEAKELLSLSEQEFLTRLQNAFGYRVGKFLSVSERTAYPLQFVRAETQIRPGFVLIGNAAHTMHPLAAQGFNLALRDIAALAEVLTDAHAQGKMLGEMSILQKYVDWRESEQKTVIRFSDQTVKLLAKQKPWLQLAISLGLITLDLLPFVRQQLTQRLLGFSGRAPKLVCGVPL